MSRYDRPYYNGSRSYDDDGGYSYDGYSDGGGDSYTSYRSRGSYSRRQPNNNYDNRRPSYRSSNTMRHRGGGVSSTGVAGSSARIYPQDANATTARGTSAAAAAAAGASNTIYDEEEQMPQSSTPQVTVSALNNNNVNNPNQTKQLVDFDSYTSDAEKLSAILRVADVELHKHALTSEYYALRKYSILVPIIIFSLFVAMAGFIAASDILSEDQRVHDATMQEFLTLTVASCGFLVLLLTLLGNQLDYASRIKFHNGAREDLAALCERMRMYRVERAMDERLVEEEMAEVRRKEMELDAGDTESEESEEGLEDEELMREDERLLLDEEQGGGSGGVADGDGIGWDAVVKLNAGELPSTLQQAGTGADGGGGGAIIAHSQGNGDVMMVSNTQNSRRQAAMQRKIARQAKKQLKLSKRLEKKNEYLTKELVNQKITQERQQQDMSKDVITFYGYHAELHQIISGCKSDVPPEISKFFQVMENRVELMSLSRLGLLEESRMRKNQIIRLCASEIYNEIQGFVFWPITVPLVDRTIEASLRTVGQMLNLNYRAQRRCKLIPCCPIPLCCKKRTSNNIFAVINEGIDQRELDMMQAERLEVLRQVNERKARLMAGPAEVLELKDEESVKVPMVTNIKKPKDPMAWMNEQNTVKQQMQDYADFGDGYSRATVDPDGSVMNEMMTEASDPKAVTRSGVNGLGLYVHEEEATDEGDGTGGGTFEGIAPPPQTEAYSQAISQQLSQGRSQAIIDEREKAEKKAKKKKKKKKQKKKNKKKSKKKAKTKSKRDESEAQSRYSEEEYENEDEYDDGSYGDVEDERSYSDDSGSY